MAEISYGYQIESDKPLQEDQILSEISNYIHQEFNKVRFYGNAFSLIVKSKLLNPVIRFDGHIEVRIKDTKAKVFLNVNTKPNGWFWFEVIVGLFFPILWFLLGFQWFTQKNKTKTLFDHLRNHLDSKFSGF